MNDGTNIASDDIILKPKFRYWLMKNFLLITLAIFVFIFSKYIREHELLKFISGTILEIENLKETHLNLIGKEWRLMLG